MREVSYCPGCGHSPIVRRDDLGESLYHCMNCNDVYRVNNQDKINEEEKQIG